MKNDIVLRDEESILSFAVLSSERLFLRKEVVGFVSKLQTPAQMKGRSS